MGHARRPRPAHLSEKLLQVRMRLGLSQSQMLKRLGDTKTKLYASHLSEYESGKREPPLIVLLKYAQAANVPVELLIDDERNLPDQLPSKTKIWVMKGGQLLPERR